MGPFEFAITLLSFVYSLALANLLMGMARMVRRRQTLRFSPEHLLWTANVFVVILVNWVTLWDFRGAKQLTLATIGVALFYAVLLYLLASFVTPDVEHSEGQDLHEFHRREGPIYVGGLLLGGLVGVLLNLGALRIGVANWANQNALLISGLPLLAIALWRRTGWMNMVVAAINLALTVALMVIYYPVLR